MSVPMETKQLLLRLQRRIPPHAREKFATGINERMESLASERTVYGALVGGAIGALIDVVPGTGFISDDWVTIGAGLGAWAGYAKDRRERRLRELIRQAIEESLKDAFAWD